MPTLWRPPSVANNNVDLPEVVTLTHPPSLHFDLLFSRQDSKPSHARTPSLMRLVSIAVRRFHCARVHLSLSLSKYATFALE
jgi:hypothetical protein